MGTLVELKISLNELSSLLDFIERAQDHDVAMTEAQQSVYVYLQSKEAEKLI